jgi:hypothetical protein
VTNVPGATARAAQRSRQEVLRDDQHRELKDAAGEYGWSVITLTPR